MTSSGVIKIGDFGLSIKLNPDDLPSDSVGTPNYLAPEVLKSDQTYDYSCDVWS